MKRTYIILSSLLIAIITVSSGVKAQNAGTQEFQIPLSSPGESGKLQVSLHHGSIRISGYSGNEVLVTVIHEADEVEDVEQRKSRDGLRRIPNNAVEFNITENNNHVRIQDVDNKESDFEIKVPNNFSLSLKTHHDGYVEINNVTGEIEVHAHHGDILMNSVGGSVAANTHHGEIKVTFQSIDSGTPMAFSTYHGDIDITFPANADASAKIKTTKGEIFTDFDMDMKPQSARIESGKTKGTKIQVGGWLQGDIGSGGPEYLFNSYHGDVIIRKK